MNPDEPAPWYERRAWMLVAALAALIALFGVFILFSPVDASDFENETGIAWSAFTASDPTVADYLTREARLLAATTLGFGLLAAGLAGTLLKRGNRTAAGLLWIFPATLTIAALVFFASGAAGLGGFYVAAALLATVALAFSTRTVRH